MKTKHLIICLLTAVITFAQLSAKPGKDDSPRLAFGRYTLDYLTGSVRNPNNTRGGLGHGIGIEVLINAPYGDDDEDVVLGWNWDNRIGWNITNNNLCSFGEYIGMWGKGLIGNDMEAGLQYSFLGYNVYQNISFLGSKLQAAFRWKNLQLTYSREGSGALYGCFYTRFSKDMSNVNGLELTLLTKKAWSLSARNIYYRFGETHTRETMILFGKAF